MLANSIQLHAIKKSADRSTDWPVISGLGSCLLVCGSGQRSQEGVVAGHAEFNLSVEEEATGKVDTKKTDSVPLCCQCV